MRLTTFVLASLLLFVFSSGSAQDKSKPESQQREAERQPSNPAPAATAPTVEINIGAPVSTPPSETHKQDSKAEARPFITGGEGVIAVITAIYAIISYYTYQAIKSGAVAELAAQSPWIAVNIEHIPGYGGRFTGSLREGSGPTTTHTDFVFHIVCVNHGRTPAWISEKRAAFKIIPKDTLPEKPDLKATTVFEDEPEPIAAGKKSLRSQKAYFFQAVGYQGIDEWAVLYGVVTYRDVFGRDRQTTFGYRITLGDELVRLAGYPRYNENT